MWNRNCKNDAYKAVLVVLLVAGILCGPFLAAAEDQDSERNINVINDLVEDYTEEIRGLFQDHDKPNGLAIIVTMMDVDGAIKDERNMEQSFKSLDFVVLKKTNTKHRKLRALIRAASEFPYIEEVPSCRVIAFYYAGHGGADSKNNSFIWTSDEKELIVRDVVAPFEPASAPSLKDISRLFFFDMCRGSRDDSGTRARRDLPVLKYAVPAKGNCLIAFAGSADFKVRGNKAEGGLWTRHLFKNIVKDLDIHVALAKTYRETVRLTSELFKDKKYGIQGPVMSSSMGPLNLRRLNESDEERFDDPVEQVKGAQKGKDRPVDSRSKKVSVHMLLKKEPQLNHLTSGLRLMENEWEELGNQLKIPAHDLASIKETVSSQRSRLTAVFEKWRLGATSPHTFENLINCVKKMGHNDNSPYIRAIYRILEEHYDEYENEPDYVDYSKNEL